MIYPKAIIKLDNLKNNIKYLKSISNDWVFGKAEPVRIGKKIQVWNIDITDEGNNLICKSRLTLAVINKK